jgi:hypothetical protein
MVLTSTDDRGLREMKAMVLNLLKDSSRSSHVAFFLIWQAQMANYWR